MHNQATCRDWREDGCAFPVCTCFDSDQPETREISASRVIARLECPEHGQTSWFEREGTRYCSSCHPSLTALAMVEYVTIRGADYQRAIEAVVAGRRWTEPYCAPDAPLAEQITALTNACAYWHTVAEGQ